MVRRSSTTSRGITYWFPCFCFTVSRLSGLLMRNFSDLRCLPRSREEKVGNKAMKEGTSLIADPSLRGFQHGGGSKANNTLSATRLS